MSEFSDIDAKTEIAMGRIYHAVHELKPIAVFGLFSGGHDSVTATKVAGFSHAFTAAVHINTGTGIKRTRQYVGDIAETQGWRLIEKCALKHIDAKGNLSPQDYAKFVLRDGFPGPHGHGMMYDRLKDRMLRELQRDFKASGAKKNPRRVMYISGCRSDESERRMANTEECQIDGQRIWVAPIHDWTKRDIHEFMERWKIPKNPIVGLIHKSGECLCGAFAKPGELEELNLWPETREAYHRIKALEAEVAAKGFPWSWEQGPPEWWMEKKRGQCFMLEYDNNKPQHLCWSCNKRQQK